MTSVESARAIATGEVRPEYSHWRHGGWYVDNLRYPSGAIGCVARTPKGWQIACDPRDKPPTFKSRDEAARAEAALILSEAISSGETTK